MEDPIRFDVWGQIARRSFAIAKDKMAALNPGLSRLELLKKINVSIVEQKLVSIATGMSWSQVQAFVSDRPVWLETTAVYQEGLGPEDARMYFCSVHDLHYGGVLGCHVCRGDHAR